MLHYNQRGLQRGPHKISTIVAFRLAQQIRGKMPTGPWPWAESYPPKLSARDVAERINSKLIGFVETLGARLIELVSKQIPLRSGSRKGPNGHASDLARMRLPKHISSCSCVRRKARIFFGYLFSGRVHAYAARIVCLRESSKNKLNHAISLATACLLCLLADFYTREKKRFVRDTEEKGQTVRRETGGCEENVC